MVVDTVRAAAPPRVATGEHPGDRYRRTFLRFHGTVLLLITVVSVIAATAGWRTGTGNGWRGGKALAADATDGLSG